MRPEPESTAAVVVTFHPDPEFGRRAEAMARTAARLIVIDNSQVNRGLAAALNQGFTEARDGGFAWVVAFDQDSDPDAELVRAGGRAWAAAPEPEGIALVGSNYFDASGTAEPRPAAAYQEREAVMTAGTLHSLAAFAELGPFREDLFIDLIDVEWCRRARRRGFRVIWSPEPMLRHSIGAATEHRLAGRRTTTSNHPPLRRYYMTRNAVALARESVLGDPTFSVRLLGGQARSLGLMLLHERGCRAKLGMAARGALDGLRGRLGPYPG